MVEASINIRQASIADAVLLAEIGARTFLETFATQNTPEDMQKYLESAFGPNIQAEELADPAGVFLIAQVGDEVAGYARIQMGERAPTGGPDIPSMEIVRLYVERRYQRSGVGAALMGECISRAKSSGSQVVWLGVWERNERAKAFYRKWGFREVGTHSFILGSDRQTDIVMERKI